ncbi:hypothetical protein GCM10027446_23170 [Angustibacter peucedani]
MSGIRAFDVEVAALTPLSPHFVRVTFAGPDLARLDDGGDLGPRDLRVKLMIPAPGHELPDLGDLDDGWYRSWLALDPVRRGSMRTYTIRTARVRGAEPQVDVDFVVHPDEAPDGGGPAARWLAAAAPGDRLTMLGPDAASAGDGPPGGVEWRPPVGDARVLLVGDETAVPAIGSILATLPPGVRAHVVAEVPSAADFLDLPTAAEAELLWCARGDRPRGEALAEALRDLLDRLGVGGEPEPAADGDVLPDVDVDAEILWETGVAASDGLYTWLAGEAAVVRDLRRHLVRERGLDRRRTSFMGYWRQGRAESA